MAGTVTRWVLRGFAVLVTVIVIGAAGVWAISNRRMARRYPVTPETLTVPTDSASIAHGQHLATAISKCVECHGENLSGQVMAMGPLGSYSSSNLTRGKGGVGHYSDADWVRAIRHGVAADGRSLVFMPSAIFASLSGPDLAALIAYIRSVPPVDHELPATAVGPIGRVLIARDASKLLPASALDHSAPLPAPVAPGPTAEYGGYLVGVGGCTYCHGTDLKGGITEGPPGTPPSQDLTTAGDLGRWTAADFEKALRTGVRPDGTAINPFMPWRLTRLMTDEEITAVWAYLKTK